LRRAVPTAPPPLSESPHLASPRPVLTAPSLLSEAAPPPCPNPAAVRPSNAVASFVHGERRPSSPLAVLRPWSVELTFHSLLTVAGPPQATVAPPHRKNATVELDFFPSLSTRSSGVLFPPPPCPAGSLTVVGARQPPFAPPPPLWRRRRPCRDARPGAVIAPACTALRRAVAGRAGRGRPSEHRPRVAHPGRASAVNTGRAPRGRGPRTRCARGPSRRRERGPSATVQLGRARFRPSDTRISFSNFRIYSNSCKFKNLCRIHLNSENYETNFVGKVLICTRF
jgi:hypothetical protein